MLEITHIKFISICFLFVIFMLWLISGEVKKTGEQMRAYECDGYSANTEIAPDYCF